LKVLGSQTGVCIGLTVRLAVVFTCCSLWANFVPLCLVPNLKDVGKDNQVTEIALPWYLQLKNYAIQMA
jgi:hypothetical protein